MSFHHKYSIADLEDMIPFELDIYTEMVQTYLKEQEERQQSQ